MVSMHMLVNQVRADEFKDPSVELRNHGKKPVQFLFKKPTRMDIFGSYLLKAGVNNNEMNIDIGIQIPDVCISFFLDSIELHRSQRLFELPLFRQESHVLVHCHEGSEGQIPQDEHLLFLLDERLF